MEIDGLVTAGLMLLAITVPLALLGVLAAAFGADSRSDGGGRNWF